MDTPDTIISILEFMEPEEIIKTCSINRQFNEACDSQYLWKKLYMGKFVVPQDKIGTLSQSEYEKDYKKAFQEEVRRLNIRKKVLKRIGIVTYYSMLYLYSLNDKQLENTLNDSISLYGNQLLTLGKFKHREYVINSLLKNNPELNTRISNIVKKIGKDENNYTYDKLRQHMDPLCIFKNESIGCSYIELTNVDDIYMILSVANKTSNQKLYKHLHETEVHIVLFYG